MEFRAAPGELVRAALEPNQSARLDLAVLQAVPPSHALNGVDFNLLGKLEELASGQQVYPIGHLSDRNTWYRPLHPVFLRGRTGDLLSFESLTAKSTGPSGGGLFDSRWRLIGMIFQDAPPETLAVPIDTVLGQLRNWGHDVALKRSAESTTVQTQDFRQSVDNVIFASPTRVGAAARPGWHHRAHHIA